MRFAQISDPCGFRSPLVRQDKVPESESVKKVEAEILQKGSGTLEQKPRSQSLNNRVYGLTTGQYTPTSPKGFKGKSTPLGTEEYPINPLELMLASGATFIARGYSHGIDLLKILFKDTIMHKGFSFVDVLQVCVSYFNMYETYNKRVYEVKNNDSGNFEEALKIIRSGTYNGGESPIPLGKFYDIEAPQFGQLFPQYNIPTADKEVLINEVLNYFI